MPDTPPTPGQACYKAYQAAYDCYIWTLPWDQLQPHFRQVWEAAAQAVLIVSMTFEEKSALNQWAQTRYDALMQEGKHGHYETMFRIIHEALARRKDTHPHV